MAQRQPEYKHVAAFVTGMLMQYWTAALGKPPVGEDFQRYLEDSLNKIWLYLTEDRSTGDFTDVQCNIGIEARSAFQLFAQ